MTFLSSSGAGSYRYSALRQNEPLLEDEEPADTVDMEDTVGGTVVQSEYGIEYGMPEGTFDSVFTYAPYNDLDKMGYEAPRRHGLQLGNRYANFTYTRDFAAANDDGSNSQIKLAPLTTIEFLIYAVSMLFVVFTMPLSLLFSLKFVADSEKLVVLRLGRAQKIRGPGIAWIVPCIDQTHRITTSITAFNVPPLQVITQDRGLVELGATVFLRIRDPILAVCGVQDRNKSVRTLANTMLYRYISKKRVCEITNIQDRRILAADFKDELAAFTCKFGVEVTDVEISEVKIVKEGENMGMAALNCVAKSDAGQQLWQVIKPAFEEFTKECAEENQGASTSAASGPLIDFGPPEPAPSLECGSGSDADSDAEFDLDRLISVANIAIDEHLTRLIGKVFEIRIDDDAEPICIDLKSQKGAARRGAAANADVVFEASRDEFAKIARRRVSPVTSYMHGKLRIRGNVQDAMLFKHLVDRMSDWL
ncbi:unnamed protein product [Caenorhabditis angaria]|uniref:Band 7 domain-containing protein n=1 Tax=Caenorhabditis angaria TaxID=860376 RepID=A0A9P1N3Z3_9PELO|nr:unnamed protein product [Caenorhabditis angaria]